MLGAAIGDIVGSRFETANHKSTDFTLFTPECNFTDDTVCTVAVAEWVLSGCKANLAEIMQKWCRRYPNPAGKYGEAFNRWIWQDHPQPYNSWGNGSAMRVSAVGWMFDTLEATLAYARASAEITHNHPEGIKGAQAIAAAIFWARSGYDKECIRKKVICSFGYALNFTCDEIRPSYTFHSSNAESVPQALTAFLESDGFEHAIRLAISLGGDSDTLAAIAGSIAEAFYYPIPKPIRQQALAILPTDMADILCSVPNTSLF